MQLIKAEQRNCRQTPQKVTLVANAVKDLPLPEAVEQLGLIEKRATNVVLKVLRQAIANAQHNFGHQVGDLSIHDIHVSEGSRYKRWQAVSRGRAHSILKRTCHIRVVLKAEEEKQAKKAVIKKAKISKKAAAESVKGGTAKSKMIASGPAKAASKVVRKVSKAAKRV